jgi:hypothetical protein
LPFVTQGGAESPAQRCRSLSALETSAKAALYRSNAVKGVYELAFKVYDISAETRAAITGLKAGIPTAVR